MGIIAIIGFIFPDCIMDIMGMIPDAFAGIIIDTDLFIVMLMGTMTIMDVFIPDAVLTFIGIIFMHIWGCVMIPNAFAGIITIMGIMIIHVMLAGQIVIMGFIAISDALIGIIVMQFIPGGHELIILLDDIISPAMGSIAAIATNPINATSMIDDFSESIISHLSRYSICSR